MPTSLLIILSIVLTFCATLGVDLIFRQFVERRASVERRIKHLYTVGDEQFARTMASFFTAPYLHGNQITALINGDEIFPAMFEAIRGARHTITFETFIYWSGDIGREFAQAMTERARAGVRVHALLDWYGSKEIDPDSIQVMADAGVEIERYHQFHFTNLWLGHLNQRTHRKLLIVDGRVGFTGGVGIADDWLGNAQDPQHWRDSHFKLEGPCVASLQCAFMDNWIKARAQVLHDEGYFPPLERVGDMACQVFQSSPDGGSESVRLMFLLVINAASRSIRISTAYFIPDALVTAALLAARKRGVGIEIIVPGEHNDEGMVRVVSRSRYGKLLRAGIKIYEYQPTMYHTKVAIVDDLWLSVGSTNFDNRSFRLNDEANLNIFDAELARSQSEVFERDKAQSRPIVLDDWNNRPWRQKLGEHAAGLLRSQL